MTAIDLYEQSVHKYEEFQEKRPDYVNARKVFLDLALTYVNNDKNLIFTADFCCGTGNNTKLLSQKLLIEKATLIDVNEKFLDIARNSGIRAQQINLIPSDILKVRLKQEHDLVISMFAYHHVPDSDKVKYIKIVKDALKVGGILLLGEIYSPDKETTLAYYEHLIESIPENVKTAELVNFLKQTATSEDFEYKVSREFTHNQLIDAGFELLNSVKIWPKDSKFADDVGTFVEIWKVGV